MTMTLAEVSSLLRLYDPRGDEYHGKHFLPMCADAIDANIAKEVSQTEEVVCEVMAFVRDVDGEPRLEFTGEGDLYDIPDGTTVWLLSGGGFDVPDDGYMSLYTHPRATAVEDATTNREEISSKLVGDARDELLLAATDYYMGFAQDEASDDGVEITGCSENQHRAARRLRDAISTTSEGVA